MRIIFFSLLCVININVFAQKLKLKNKEFNFTIGSSELKVDKFSPNENLDFLNFVDFDPDYTDFIILKLGYKFDFFSKMSADIKLVMMDDIIPDNFDISVYYFVTPSIGIGVGSMLNKGWITGFEEYQSQYLSNYFILDDNVKQFINYDLGFYLSPIVKPIDNDIFKLQLSFDLGISSFNKQSATFYYKKEFSNERVQYHYNTTHKYQPYIQPKIDIRLKLFKIKNTSIGLLLNSNYYYSQKSINYTRSIQSWTLENSTTEQIKPAKHEYSRYEVNMGIYMNL